jgi:hypothetical protein
MSHITAYLLHVWNGWNRFWFDSRNDSELTILAAFRLFFGAVMFFCYFVRAFDVDFFFTANGIMPLWHEQSIEYFKYHPTFLTDSMSYGTVQAIHALFLLCLGALTLGVFTRFSAIATYVLHMAFINRNMSVMFGVDMIATFFLLYLCFADSNARWSIDAWRGKGAKRQSALSHIAWRLMQIQVCVVYGFSGLEKMKGTRWWDGSAIWDVMSIGNMQRFDLSFVAHMPLLLAASVYIVLIWEVYFPALIWQRKMRLPILAFGLIMHLGIYVFMNLPSFGFMMITLYLLFLKKSEIEGGMRGLSLIRPKRS